MVVLDTGSLGFTFGSLIPFADRMAGYVLLDFYGRPPSFRDGRTFLMISHCYFPKSISDTSLVTRLLEVTLKGLVCAMAVVKSRLIAEFNGAYLPASDDFILGIGCPSTLINIDNLEGLLAIFHRIPSKSVSSSRNGRHYLHLGRWTQRLDTRAVTRDEWYGLCSLRAK